MKHTCPHCNNKDGSKTKKIKAWATYGKVRLERYSCGGCGKKSHRYISSKGRGVFV